MFSFELSPIYTQARKGHTGSAKDMSWFFEDAATTGGGASSKTWPRPLGEGAAAKGNSSFCHLEHQWPWAAGMGGQHGSRRLVENTHTFFLPNFKTTILKSCGRPPFGVVVLRNCLSPPRLSLKSTGHMMLLLPCPWWIHCQSKISGVGWRWSRSQLSGHLRSRSCRIFWSVTFMPMWLLSYGEVTGTCCVNQDQTKSMARWWPAFGR